MVYDFTDSRSGEHARDFLGTGTDKAWRGSLVCDDFTGYKALFAQGVTEVGCMAHARRKFVELHVANKSDIAATDIEFIGHARIRAARGQGWCLVNQELEEGLISIAAINISGQANRTTAKVMQTQLLPALLQASQSISRMLASRRG